MTQNGNKKTQDEEIRELADYFLTNPDKLENYLRVNKNDLEKFEEAKKEKKEAEKKINDLEKEKEALKKDLEGLEREKVNLEKKLSDADKSKTDKIAELRKKLEKSEKEKEVLKKDLEGLKAANTAGNNTKAVTGVNAPSSAAATDAEGKYSGITFCEIQYEIARETGKMIPKTENLGKDHVEMRYFTYIGGPDATRVEKYFDKNHDELELKLSTLYPNYPFIIKKGYVWIDEKGVPTEVLKGYELESCERIRA